MQSQPNFTESILVRGEYRLLLFSGYLPILKICSTSPNDTLPLAINLSWFHLAKGQADPQGLWASYNTFGRFYTRYGLFFSYYLAYIMRKYVKQFGVDVLYGRHMMILVHDNHKSPISAFLACEWWRFGLIQSHECFTQWRTAGFSDPLRIGVIHDCGIYYLTSLLSRRQ